MSQLTRTHSTGSVANLKNSQLSSLEHTTTSLPEHIISQLNDKNIDWEGVCQFDENGKFAGFRNSSNPRNCSGLKPIPESTGEIIEAKQTLDEVMRTATKQEFAVIITALSLHCGMQKKDPNAVKSMMNDYWQDMCDYPKYLIEKACAKYRKLADGNEFMPRSGKLLSLINAEYSALKRMERRINKIIGIQPQANLDERRSGMVSIDRILQNFN